MYAPPIQTGRTWPAVLAAGPVFLAMVMIATMIGPDTVSVADSGNVGMVAGAVAMLIVAAVFGTVPAVVPVVVGTALMRGLARHVAAAQLAVIWALTGAGLGAAIGWFAESGSEGIFVMAATGAICAGISHAGQRW